MSNLGAEELSFFKGGGGGGGRYTVLFFILFMSDGIIFRNYNRPIIDVNLTYQCL